MLKKFTPPTKKLIYINLTPAEDEKSEKKNKKWFAPPNTWRLDFYIVRLSYIRKHVDSQSCIIFDMPLFCVFFWSKRECKLKEKKKREIIKGFYLVLSIVSRVPKENKRNKTFLASFFGNHNNRKIEKSSIFATLYNWVDMQI